MARKLPASHITLAVDRKLSDEAVKEVLKYFIRKPEAADSLEGIARWRLLEEVVNRKLEETRSALEWLVRKKFLKKTELPGGEEVFSLNPDKRSEAAKFVAAPDPRPRRRYKSG